MSRSHLALLLACLLLAHLAAAQPPPLTPSVVLIDGRSIPLADLSIAGGKLQGDGLAAGLEIDDLREIVVAPLAAAPKDKPGIAMQLVGGGRLRAESLTIDKDACHMNAAGVEKLAIPLEKVRAIRFDTARLDALDKAVAAPSAELDRFFLKVDDQVESVSGVTIALTAEELKAQVDGSERSIPRSRLVALVVAQPTAEDEVPYVTVTLRDGSTLPGQIESLKDGKLLFSMPRGGKVEVPWSAVARVSVRSRRVAFLSDLKPLAVEQRSIAFLDLPWRRDRSVMGRTLTLGNRTFDKGIGVHATSKLTFDPSGNYDELAAQIGIDAETGGKGDCVFSVLGDGESLFSQRVKGTDPPQSIRVDIRGKKEVTLVVDAGEGLDLADHADWCDARLIRNGERGASAPR